MIKILATIIVCVGIAAIFTSFFSLVRFAYVHFKAYLIRRKLSKLAETETKKDD